MRLLHVNHRYTPYSGGSEIVVQRISEALAADGHEVFVVTSDAFDLEYFWDRRRRKVVAPDREMIGNVSVIRVPVRHLPLSSLAFRASRRFMGELARAPLPPRPFAAAARLQPWMPELRETLHSIGPVDAVLATNLGLESLAIAARDRAREVGAAFVLVPFIHLGSDDDTTARRYVTMPHHRCLMCEADAVLTMTEHERRFVIEQGADPRRVVVTGAGVDEHAVTGGDGAAFRQRHRLDGFVVGSLGPPSAEKGTPDLVRAVAALRRRGRNVRLVLAGPPLSGFARWFDRLAPEERSGTSMLGYIDAAERRDLLAAIDAFALPSRTESFGIVYLEAWLNRKPVIAARAGAVPEIVRDGETGLLVPFGDQEAIAAAIERVMDDAALRCSLAEAGYQLTLSRYRWDDVLQRVRHGYSIALARRGRNLEETQ